MKKIVLLFAVFCIVTMSSAQQAQDILKMSFKKCLSVQNGYYEMTRLMKFTSHKDTTINTFKCYFKKLKEDTLYSSAFHYTRWDGTYNSDVLYTGEELVTAYQTDSIATITSKSSWAKEIQESFNNYIFYSPLIDENRYPLPRDSDYLDNQHMFKLIGDENIGDIKCYHVQVNEIIENDPADMATFLRIEYHFWINKSDSIPVQFSTAYDLVMNNDTMYQYELCTMNKYELNNLKDEHVFTLGSIPAYYKLQDYVPYEAPSLLPLNSTAPDWELNSLAGEKLSLKNLKGELVLVDFFYKGCYPCMLALPTLQELHEKYKSSGLRVIGIDPIDDKEDDMPQFLSKRGVTYSVLLSDKDLAKEYRVSGYPTLFLINKEGEIVYIHVGYNADLKTILEELINRYLAK